MFFKRKLEIIAELEKQIFNQQNMLDCIRSQLEIYQNDENENKRRWEKRNPDLVHQDFETALGLIFDYQKVLIRMNLPDPMIKKASILLARYEMKKEDSSKIPFQVMGLQKEVKEEEGLESDLINQELSLPGSKEDWEKGEWSSENLLPLKVQVVAVEDAEGKSHLKFVPPVSE